MSKYTYRCSIEYDDQRNIQLNLRLHINEYTPCEYQALISLNVKTNQFQGIFKDELIRVA